MSKLKVAYQTMNATEDIDTIGLFEAAKKIKACGYNAFEISGHFECNETLINDAIRCQKELGMDVCAMSVVYTGQYVKPMKRAIVPLRLIEDFDRVVEYCGRIGVKNVRFAGMPVANFTCTEDVLEYCRLTEEYAQKLAPYGIKLCMHNHHQEFVKFDGKFAIDYVIENCPTVCFEFDVLGMLHGSADVYERMEMVKGRMPIMHYEETKIVNLPAGGPSAVKEARVPCRLGEGCINVPRFVKVAEECGLEYLIIEATNKDGLEEYECMKRSADNFKALGFADRF